MNTEPYTVLLVEGNPSHAELVLRSFEDHRVANRIIHLSDGKSALDYLFRRGPFADPAMSPRPHLVLLELRLPRIDGLDVLKMIRTSEELHTLPVVILTTSEAEQDAARAYEQHANSYLVKPLDFEGFTALMRDLSFYWLEWNYYPWTGASPSEDVAKDYVLQFGEAEIALTINSDLESFSSNDQERLLEEIQKLLGISDQIRIISKRQGSVKLNIVLPHELAEQLFWAVKRGELAAFKVTDAEIIGRATAEAIVRRKIRDGEYDVFLCHNHTDKEEVMKIGEKLKQYGLLSWLDEWELRPGVPWQKALQDQIGSIKSAAIFVGSNGYGPWQNMEIDAFIRQFVKRGCPVIPVILRSCKAIPELPPFLDGMAWVNFRKRKPAPLQRLIWGITGKRITPT